MNVAMEQSADIILQSAREDSLDDLSDVEVDADGSSSLSEIEDKDADDAEDMEVSDDDLSNISDEENDSEAETERLDDSPHNFRQQQDVVLSSRSDNNNNNQGYAHSPSKLHKEIRLELQEDDDEEELSEEDLSCDDSPKSSTHDEPALGPSTTTSLEDSSREDNKISLAAETDTRKRKRSIMAGSGLDENNEESPRKRTGSIMVLNDEYAIEDENEEDAAGDICNGISGNIFGEEGEVAQKDAPEEVDDPAVSENLAKETNDILISPRKRGRRKKKGMENETGQGDDEVAQEDPALNGDNDTRNGVDHEAENEGDDEADLLSKDEEELERKRIALEQLSAIEGQFTTFRERLYQERLQQLDREEAMIRQPTPTHPEYLAMMQSIDSRRDEKFRVADKIKEYQMQSLANFAVSKRSQILTQYQQEVREIREKKLEQLGKQWYEIQHDRRSYAGSVPEYTLKFPSKKSQQVQNQVAYSKEASILSGVAKYVGFPAAPPMAPTTAEELEEDLERMGRTRPAPHRVPSFPMQELAALRAGTSRFKPAAEEQFIEQTPWANPQHPSHAHLLQRQSSAQQIPQTTSPFSQVQVQPTRRNSPHGVPISGTFTSTSSFHNSNGVTMPGGRVSPHNPFSNSNLSHAIAPSPLGSRQTSLSPQQNRRPPIPENHISQDVTKSNGIHHPPPLVEPGRDLNDVRREQTTAMMTRF